MCRKIISALLLSTAVLCGCSGVSSPSLEDVRYVSDEDFQAITLPEPHNLGIEIDGAVSLRVHDTVIFVNLFMGDKIMHLFSTKNASPLGEFFTIGRGPGELLSPPSNICFESEAGDIVMRFYDYMSKNLLKMDVTKSIVEKEPVLDTLGKVEDSVLAAIIIDDNTYFSKKLSPKFDAQIRFLHRNGEQEQTPAMERLNSYVISSPDGAYNFNLLSGAIGYGKETGNIVEAMTNLNTIQVYPVEGDKEGFSICYGKKLRDYHSMEKTLDEEPVKAYANVTCEKSYFSALYIEEEMDERTKNLLQIYSWDGTPMYSISIPVNVTSYSIDASAGALYTLDEDGVILRYYIPQLQS